jgi:hypothetical protein
VAPGGARRRLTGGSPEFARSRVLVHGFQRGFDLREVGNEANLNGDSGRRL